MKLRPTLHDARVDLGGPVRALSSPAAHSAHAPHLLCTPASEISLDLSPSNRLTPCQLAPSPPQTEHAPNPNPISRSGQWKAGHGPPCTRTRRRVRGQLRSCPVAGCSQPAGSMTSGLGSQGGWQGGALPHRPSKPIIIQMQQPSAKLGMKQTSGPFLPPKPRLSRHHTPDEKGSSTPASLTSSYCRTRQ
jgi:hypothetical protein